MNYAFLVFLIGKSGNKTLFASVSATEKHYDGLGYLQPDSTRKVLEAAAARIEQLTARNDFIGVSITHPATQLNPVREEDWEFETSARSARPLAGSYQLSNGRTIFCAAYRKVSTKAIEL